MRRNRIGRIALAVFAAGVIAGCRNGMEEVVPPENAPSQASMSSRETARIAEALRDDAPNPLLVERKFREMARAMQDGTLDFSRGEFFSGMTDEALQRQAMLTWNLAPVFGKMENGSRVAVVVGDGRPAGRVVRQALVSLLAANAEKVTVIDRYDAGLEQAFRSLYVNGPEGAKSAGVDYFLRARPISLDVFRSWSANRYGLPYLQRFAAASAWLELCDVRNDRLLWAGPVESYRNYVGNNEPLLWLYDAMGRETSVMAISPAVVALMDSGNLSGYAFGPSNELLVDRAFRRVKLDGTAPGALAGTGKTVVVELDGGGNGGGSVESIQALLLDRGVRVVLSPYYQNFADLLERRDFTGMKYADYALICRVDYAGATALPDAPGSGTFRRQGAVVFWAELVELATRRVVWAGQLTGKSEVVTDPLLYYPVIFRDRIMPELRRREPVKSLQSKQ